MQRKVKLRRRISKKSYAGIAVAHFLLVLILWTALSKFQFVNTLFLPTPLAVVKRFFQNLQNGSLGADTVISIYRITMGFLLATVLGVPIGILCSCFKRCAAFFKPMCEFVRYMPVPAFVPLLMVWLGIGEFSKIMVVFIGTFFQMVLMVIDNANSVPDDLLATSYTLGANDKIAIFTVLLPAMAPALMQTLRMMIGWAWTYLVVAELVAANSGLGYSILKAQRFLKTENIFVGILVIGVLGLATDFLFNLLIKKLFPWSEGGEK